MGPVGATPGKKTEDRGSPVLIVGRAAEHPMKASRAMERIETSGWNIVTMILGLSPL